jgi:hypothetical protein
LFFENKQRGEWHGTGIAEDDFCEIEGHLRVPGADAGRFEQGGVGSSVASGATAGREAGEVFEGGGVEGFWEGDRGEGIGERKGEGIENRGWGIGEREEGRKEDGDV